RLTTSGVPYRYGHEWLIEQLPQEVYDELVDLCDRIDAMAGDGPEPEMWVEIDGERLEVDKVYSHGRNEIRRSGHDYVLFESSEEAGKAAREYWEEMAERDEEEFASLVGQETLVRWALGKAAGPGSSKVSSLEDWLDLWLDTPEEHWARYDGRECIVT